MFGLGFALFVAGTFLCVFFAGRMAIARARPAILWMLAAALFGPLPLIVLAFIPKAPPAGA